MTGRRLLIGWGVLLLIANASPGEAENWPQPSPPVIAGTRGYVEIPNAAIPRDRRHLYKAVFDVKAANPKPVMPAAQLQRIALQLNGLANAGVPGDKIDFVAMVHGPAADMLLTDAAYRAKHGAANPNLALVRAMTARGVRFLVCGQYLAGHAISQSDLIPEATVAEAATLVLIRLQNGGYALLTDN